METEELGSTTLGSHLHKPVLGDFSLPMNLPGSHWEWGHTCSLRTVRVGKSKSYRMKKVFICQEIKKKKYRIKRE